MKQVFFSASTYSIPELLDNYLIIIDEIKKNNSITFLDWTKNWVEIAEKYKKKGKYKLEESDFLQIFDRKKLYEEHIVAIEKCDYIIAEVTRPTISVGYQLFHAILNKKPVLALYDAEAKNLDFKKIKSIINTESPLITFKKYRKKSLPRIIKHFIEKKSEILTKFNFVISEEVEKYIDWLSKKNPNRSKSELLRQRIIDEIVFNDEEYQDYINSKVT